MQYREKIRSKVQKRPGADILPEYGFEQRYLLHDWNFSNIFKWDLAGSFGTVPDAMRRKLAMEQSDWLILVIVLVN